MKPLSERERKIIASLKQTKYRREEKLFLAEGIKCIELLLNKHQLEWLVLSDEEQALELNIDRDLLRVTTISGLKRLSNLDSRQELLAVFKIPDEPLFPKRFESLAVGLEEIQNPGNLGTIIRLCDWLGIKYILCSKGCVDLYHPKVVQASMGALGSVVVFQDVDFSEALPSHFDQIIVTTMEGKPYRELREIKDSAVLLFGNEGKGLTPKSIALSEHNITIPKAMNSVSESLNVSISASILLSYFSNLK